MLHLKFLISKLGFQKLRSLVNNNTKRKNESSLTVSLTFNPRSQFKLGPSQWSMQQFIKNQYILWTGILFTDRHTHTNCNENITPPQSRRSVTESLTD